MLGKLLETKKLEMEELSFSTVRLVVNQTTCKIGLVT